MSAASPLVFLPGGIIALVACSIVLLAMFMRREHALRRFPALTILVLVVIAYVVFWLWAGILDIKSMSIYDTLLIGALFILAIYRLIDRMLGNPENIEVLREEARTLLLRKLAEAIKEKPAKTWLVSQLRFLADYFNIWKMAHERKRDRLVALLMQTKQTSPDNEGKIINGAYITAENIIRTATNLRKVEETGAVIGDKPADMAAHAGLTDQRR